MRFLCASDFLPEPDSGAAGSILAIGEALAQRGHSVDYLWRSAAPWRLPHSSLARLFELPRRQYRQVAAQLQQTPYDVVVVSQPYGFLIYQRLARRFPGTLFLNRTHGWEARADLAQRQFHWREDLHGLNRALSALSSRVVFKFCEWTARACMGLITPASPCAKFIISTHGIDPATVRAIVYGIDTTLVPARSEASYGRTARRLIFAGNYLTRKGTRFLEKIVPRMADQFPDVNLTFVVQREHEAIVRERFSPAFPGRLDVKFWMARPELLRVVAGQDIFLYTSLFESFGKTFLEAMACGACVVGFEEGGVCDIARSGHDALYCSTGDEARFQTLLWQALAQPGLAAAIGRNARETALRYTWEKTAAATEQFCAELQERRLLAREKLRV